MDVLDALKRAGYSTYRLRKDGLLSEKAIAKLRNGVDLLSWGELETVCNLLDVPFSDVVTDQRAQQRDDQRGGDGFTWGELTVLEICLSSQADDYARIQRDDRTDADEKITAGRAERTVRDVLETVRQKKSRCRTGGDNDE